MLDSWRLQFLVRVLSPERLQLECIMLNIQLHSGGN